MTEPRDDEPPLLADTDIVPDEAEPLPDEPAGPEGTEPDPTGAETHDGAPE